MASAATAIKNIKFSPVDIEARKKLDFRAGDTVRVWSKIPEEKGKFRLQAFEGMVIGRKHGAENGATFTVRRIASGVGVERIFPIYSPMVDKIEVVKKAKARRSKLYYVRVKAVKDVRRKMRSVTSEPDEAIENTAETPAEAKAAE